MTLSANIDSTNMAIIKAIAGKPNITTREIEAIAYLSRTQVLRRLKQIEEAGWIVRSNGKTKTYRYVIDPNVTPEDLERLDRRLNINRDPVAREALELLLQGMRLLTDQMADLVGRIESILK